MSNKEIEKLKREINKKYGEGTVTTAGKAVAMKLVRIPTGSFTLDVETGGGYPRGRITILAGLESSGKSFLAFKAVAEAQAMYPDQICWWIDHEGSFQNEWAENFGIDLSRLEIVRPATTEQALDIATVLIGRTDIPLVVIDSLAAMSPSAEVEKGMEEFTMGLGARQNNKFFRKAQAMLNQGSLEENNLKPAVIIINQLRETMDKYRPHTLPGGKGQAYASSITIMIRVGEKYVEKRDGFTFPVYVGHSIKFKTEKNKTFAPMRQGEFDIYVEESQKGFVPGQIDRVKELIPYGVRYNFIYKAGAWFTILGRDDWKFQGSEKVTEFLRANPDVRVELEKLIKMRCFHNAILNENGEWVDVETGEILDEGELYG